MHDNAQIRWQRDPAEAWAAWQPTAEEPWDLARVLALHRRAGFGATWAEAQRDLADGYEASIMRTLEGAPTAPDGRGAVAVDTFCDAMFESYRTRASALDLVRQAWLYRLAFSPWPLRERMILAWHGHYATSEAKVRQSQLLAAQHLTQRKLWRAPISELHLAMLRDESMLRWLDGTENQRGAPNENLAREFLELFALGIGNYSEQDVRGAARALTGWQFVYNLPQDVRYQPVLHDADDKTILDQTGPWKDEDLVRITCAHPAAARRIAWRLWRTFISDVDQPSPELLDGLAATMRAGGDVDVGRGLEALLRSRLFHSDAYAGRRVLSPVEWTVSVVRRSQTFPPHPTLGELVAASEQMGQRLFRPPNVAGWPGGIEWLSAPALVARQNFVAWLTSAESSAAADHWQKLAARYQVPEGETEIDFWSQLYWGRVPRAEERPALLATMQGASGNSRAQLIAALLNAPGAQVV